MDSAVIASRGKNAVDGFETEYRPNRWY